MKKIILLVVLAVIMASCAGRQWVANLENNMEYNNPVDPMKMQKVSVKILESKFFVTNKSQFLLEELTKERRNLVTGETEKLWSEFPFVLYKVPGLVYYKLDNQTATVTNSKEIRNKIFLSTEKNVKLPLEILTVLDQEWICFPISSNKVFPQLKMDSGEEIILVAMVPLTKNARIDIGYGESDISVSSPDGIYVLFPETVKKPYHKIWKKGGTSNYSNIRSLDENAVYHVVVPGENLWTISKKWSISYTDILSLNSSLENPNKISSGDSIRVR